MANELDTSIVADSRCSGISTCATGPSIYVDVPSIRSWISTQVGGGLPV